MPEGGPDGGDGGKGGDVVFVADHNMHTLMDFKYKHRYEAQNGTDGMKKKRYGKKGEDLVIKVPPGTVIIDHNSGFVMKDLVNQICLFATKGYPKRQAKNVHQLIISPIEAHSKKPDINTKFDKILSPFF